MRILRIIGYGFMALVLAGGWAFIYWQSGAVDLAAVDAARIALAELRSVDAGWNQQLVRARLHARGAASAAAPTSRHRTAYAALEAAAAPAPALPPDAAVLVLGEAALARAAKELSKNAYKVFEAAGADAALEVLAAEEIAALVCDLDSGGQDPAAFLRILKKASPQPQLIAVSAASDSEMIISLINEARIYRFLKKPVNFSLLQAALAAALGRYARMAKSPALLRAESARQGRQGAAERSILGRIKSLGGRFTAALRR